MTTRVDLGLDPRFPVVEGDDRIFNFRIANNIGGTPQPIPSGSVLTYSVFPKDPEVEAGTAIFSYAIGTGITITDATNGKVELRLDGGDTAGLAGDRFHRLVMTFDSFTQRVFVGTLRLRERA